jgi:ferritin
MKDVISKALSAQVNAEYYSAYLYLTMSAWADNQGLKGVANWLFVQAKEEMAHGTHIYEHLLERGEQVTFSDIKKPETEFKSIKEVFEKVSSHEKHVTELINNIASLALHENDHATYNFILWYVNEQIEEESTADDLLRKITQIGDNLGLLYSFDAELATRTFTDPFASAE